MTKERTQNLSDVMTAQMKTDADNKEQLSKNDKRFQNIITQINRTNNELLIALFICR